MPANLLLQLGSNEGQPARQLALARRVLIQRLGPLLRASSLYRTAAWGPVPQADFLNQVIWIVTSLPPRHCLDLCLRTELDLGRERREKWGPRRIDIDLLFYDALVVNEPGLSLPHPWLHQRRFVLEPLHEIAPHYYHPVQGATIAQLLAQCTDTGTVQRLTQEEEE